jgi:hypothetical protein
MLLLFNRETSGRLLDEAEELVAQGRSAPAAIIAGTVLEYLLRSPAVKLLADSRKSEFNAWRRLRDQAAHGTTSPDAEEVRRMLQALRGISVSGTAAECGTEASGPRRAPGSPVRGKYTRVRTSADEFMKRKREEVELEDRK